MQVLGGEFRGRLLKAPKSSKTRPTLAILRKAVFDMLQQVIVDARFLDLFAGSGLMGIEALSRGASFALFVDNARESVRCIQENVQCLNLQKKVQIWQLDAMRALHKCVKKKLYFDIIYIDPPYTLSQTTSILQEILSFIDTHTILAQNGALFIEETNPIRLDSAVPLHTLRHRNTRSFSQSVLHYWSNLNK